MDSLATFDPLSLPESPLTGLIKQFENAWSLGERMRNISRGPLSTGESLYEDYRQTHLIIAHTVVASEDPTAPFFKCRYFSIQDKEQTFCIAINVFDKPRVGPDHQASWGGSLGADLIAKLQSELGKGEGGVPEPAPAPEPPGPILAVRYAMSTRSDGPEKVRRFVQCFARAQAEGQVIRQIHATLPELRQVARMLRQGTRRMSPTALARHAAAGGGGGGGGGGAGSGSEGGFWALSFMGVPAPTPEKFSMSDQEFLDAGLLPCSCGCDEPGAHRCSGCKGAVYAMKECQKRHWKEHKLVCSRSDKGGANPGAATVAGALSAPPPKGPSILIDLTIDDNNLQGNVMTSIALNPGGVHNHLIRGAGGEAPLNRHGSKRFIVKAQRPLDGPLMLIYDDTRGLHHFVAIQRAPQLSAAIAKERAWGGLKAYFFAVREGDSLRVFTGEFAPTQRW